MVFINPALCFNYQIKNFKLEPTSMLNGLNTSSASQAGSLETSLHLDLKAPK